MKLEQCRVHHIRYGAGTVVSCEEHVIRVAFPELGEKQFLYPDAFAHFLRADDPETAAQVAEEIILKKAEEEAIRREREAIAAAVAAQQSEKKPARQRKRK